MTAFKILSVAGDSVIIGSDPRGITLTMIPATPSEDNAVDVFSVGLNFSSVTRVLACLRGGAPVVTDDGGFRISMVAGTPTLEFALQHRRDTLYPARLEPDGASALEDHLSSLLSGSTDVVGSGATPHVTGPKVPRNSPCPCGSGRKYKKCCLGKEQRSSSRDELSFVGASSDPIVKELVGQARHQPIVLSDPQFWNELGKALGTSGDQSCALVAFRRGGEMAPDDPSFQLNMAVSEEALGNLESAFSLLDEIPDGYPRKSVVKANLLMGSDRYEEAIPYYEQAIAEEPNFFVPYVQLLYLMERTRNPLLDYWMDRAVKAVPESAAIAKFYVDRLFREQRLHELAQADWIDRLRSEHGRPDMIGRNSNDPRIIVEAQLFRSIGLALASSDVAQLERAVAILEAADSSWHLCDPAKILAASAANLGAAAVVRAAYDRICSHCQRERIGIEGPLSTYLALAHGNAGEFADAIVCAEDALEQNPEDLTALRVSWWCLDEVDRPGEALEAAQRLDGLSPSEGYLQHNLGFLSGKNGSLGLARHYWEKALEEDPSNFHAAENLSFASLRDGELSAAKLYWDRHIELLTEAAREAAAYDEDDNSDAHRAREEFLEQKQEKWSRLLQAAEMSARSASYAFDLISFNKSTEPVIGSPVRIVRTEFSIDKMLDALDRRGEETIELRHQLKMQKRGDMSALVASLSREVPFWSQLPDQAQAALIEGERRISDRGAYDHAPDIVSFAKAVEISLRRLVFDRFATEQKSDLELKKHVQVALHDKFRQAHRFVRFVERGQHLELGAMTHSLKLCRGKTGRKVLLIGRFREFIEERLGWRELLSEESLADLVALAERRNPAAHELAFGESEARETREIALAVLRRLGC